MDLDGEVLYHRVGEQRVRNLLNRQLVDRVAYLEFESFPLTYPLHTPVAESGEGAENGLPLGVRDLRFQHDFDDNPGHTESLTRRARSTVSDADMNGWHLVLTRLVILTLWWFLAGAIGVSPQSVKITGEGGRGRDPGQVDRGVPVSSS